MVAPLSASNQTLARRSRRNEILSLSLNSIRLPGFAASLRSKARDAGKRLGIPLQEGVYCALLGPTYETPAEIRMLRTLGADAVGMSTVPEVIAARHRGIKVLGISFISNAAAGMSGQPLSHEEVTAEADKARPRFEQLLLEIVASL